MWKYWSACVTGTKKRSSYFVWGKDRNLADQLKEADFSGLYDTLRVFLVGELSDRTLDFVSAHGELLSARIIAAYLRFERTIRWFLDAREVIRNGRTVR